VDGMNEKELREFQTWTLKRLKDYLVKKGMVTDKKWLDNYLRLEIQRAMIHISRATSKHWLKKSNVYQLMGLDFTLDDNLNLWFIEGNSNPALIPYSEERRKILKDLIKDMLKINFGLLRSRIKRIIIFMNEIAEENPKTYFEPEEVKALAEKYKEKFEEVIKNRFEPGFIPASTSSFRKIIDDNLDGVERYSNLIDKECL